LSRVSRRSFLRGTALAAAAAWPRRRARAGRGGFRSPGERDHPYFSALPVVGRVTDRGAVVNLVSAANLATTLRARVRWAPAAEGLGPNAQVSPAASVSGPWEKLELPLSGLSANTRYCYRAEYETAEEPEVWREIEETGEFRSQRGAGEAFDFSVIADAHWGEREFDFDLESVWGYNGRACLAQILADGESDFCVDLGDSAYLARITSEAQALRHYAEYRRVLAPLLARMPLYYVLGNHEQEAGFFQHGDGGAISMSEFGNHLEPDEYHQKWGTHARLTFIPNPRGDTYPQGGEGAPGCDSSADWGAGSDPWNDGERAHLQNFYAWSWGDALFVVLDPFRYTLPGQFVYTTAPQQWALGETQMRWLEETLAASQHRWKFVFAHHLVGGGLIGIDGSGIDEGNGRAYGRGSGVEAGRMETEQAVVHRLMQQHRVQFFVYGHDHCFCHSVLDDIHYLSCGRPSYLSLWFNNGGILDSYGDVLKRGGDRPWTRALYTVLGYTRFHVSPEEVRMEWVRTGFSFRPNVIPNFYCDFPERDWLECWAGRSYREASADAVVVARVPRDVDGVRTKAGAAIRDYSNPPDGQDYYLQPIPTRPEAYQSTTIPLHDFPAGNDGVAVVDYVPEVVYRQSWTADWAGVAEGSGGAARVSLPVRSLRSQPNPFSAGTEISFEAAARLAEARLAICDVSGRMIRTLALGDLPRGRRYVRWDGRTDGGDPVPAGVYLVRVEHRDGASAARRILRVH